ncbi:MAG: Bcr/CflA family drug resistance efflux transporter [Halomonadaceae bacterium]|nr:MAG: Bcr/CflA family drug resistance efflux transporter [Halomonadaceae bacterium]
MTRPIEKSFVITLGLLVGLSPLAVDLYLPSMPAIAADLAASPGAVNQTLSIYLACFALPQLVFGPLSDAYGRRLIMFTGLIIFLLGSLACAFAGDIQSLILSRALQGLGAAAIIVTVPALVRDRFENEAFARVMGLIMMVMAVAPLIGPLLGGLILQVSGWQMNFLLLAVLAVCALGLFHVQIGETLPRQRRIPFRPSNLMKNYGAILRHGSSLSFMLCGGFAFAGMMGFLTASPFVYIEHYGTTELQYGLLFACNILTIIAFTALGNRFVAATGSLVMLGVAMGILLLASLLHFSLALTTAPPLWLVVVAVMLFVGTNGLVSANSMALVMKRFGHTSGSVSALAGSLRFGSGAIAGVAISLSQNGSPWPMFVVMASCGVGAIGFYGVGIMLAKQEDQQIRSTV